MADPDPLVSFVVATYNRPTDLSEALDAILAQRYDPIEVIVVSSSTDETAALFEADGRFDLEGVHYHTLDGRSGVPEARNVGYGLASGEILVTVDDDAVLPDPDATARLVSLFRRHPDVGVVAFRSRRYDTGEPILMEIPDPPRPGQPPDEPYRACSFCGVGNAIRRELLEDVGAFAPDFVYGFEEHDLSLRLLDAGWDILYAPSIPVDHKQTPTGRLPSAEARERQIENRIKLAVRNLPWRYVAGTALVWSAYAVVTASFRLAPLGRIVRHLYDQRGELLDERDVIDARTIAMLKGRRAMLYAWWFGPDPRRILANPGRLRW